jgi:hypothetical protein
MPKGSRRRARALQGHPELDEERARTGFTTREIRSDGEFHVRQVRADSKTYRCPGCAQEIPPGVLHVVVIQADSLFGEQDAIGSRRHWHQSCWRSGGRGR